LAVTSYKRNQPNIHKTNQIKNNNNLLLFKISYYIAAMNTNFNLSDTGERILEETIRPIAVKNGTLKPKKSEMIELALQIASSITHLDKEDFRQLTGIEK
jgi:hypothetical protein